MPKVTAFLQVSNMVLKDLGLPLNLPAFGILREFHVRLLLYYSFLCCLSFFYDVEDSWWLADVVNYITLLVPHLMNVVFVDS
jgi:hypothetical protein